MFCAVAEGGGLGAASNKLHLTPSAISHGLKSLERQLGCRVFERAGKRLVLNQAGEHLLAKIKPPLAELDAAADSLRRLGKWGQTRLRLGAAASLCQHLLPRVIRELKKSYPQIELQVESGDTAELMKMIHANQIDLALGVAPDHDIGLEARPLFRDELMFMLAPSHPWAEGKPISRDELRTQPLILYQRASLTARLLNEFFQRLDLVPCAVMEVGNIEAIKELVRLNLGVAVLAPWTAERELARGLLKVRPLGNKPLTRNWVALSLAGRRFSLAEESACKLIRHHAAGMRLDRKDVASA